VESKDGRVCVELMSLASDVDWEIARWLLASGLNLGAEAAGEEGQALGAGDFDPAKFRARYQAIQRAELGMSRSIMAQDGGDTLRLPVAHFELTLPKADLGSMDIEAILDSLVQQCYAYGNAYVAKLMEWEAADGTRSKEAHYASISTLVPADVQGITFSGPEGRYTEAAVPLDRVKTILAEFIRPVGKFLYFPPIHWDQQPALLEALTGKSTKEIIESLDRQLGESVVRLPVLAFVITANADGSVDQQEMQALLDYLNECTSDEADQTLFANACRCFRRDMKQVIAGIKGLNHAVEFQWAIRQLDHRLKPDICALYKQRLYQLAERVAKASGGPETRSEIADAQQQALGWMKAVLMASES
jgi:hypothetical protein